MKKTHQIDYNVGAWNEWMNDQNKVTVAHPTIYSEACELRKSNKHWASVIKVRYLGSRYILFYHGVNFTSSKQIGQNLT
jgi:hypothetical protein